MAASLSGSVGGVAVLSGVAAVAGCGRSPLSFSRLSCSGVRRVWVVVLGLSWVAVAGGCRRCGSVAVARLAVSAGRAGVLAVRSAGLGLVLGLVRLAAGRLVALAGRPSALSAAVGGVAAPSAF